MYPLNMNSGVMIIIVRALFNLSAGIFSNVSRKLCFLIHRWLFSSFLPQQHISYVSERLLWILKKKLFLFLWPGQWLSQGSAWVGWLLSHCSLILCWSLVNLNLSVLMDLYERKRKEKNISIFAGSLSEDPNFPKIQWPPPDLCPTCHALKDNMDHRWNHNEVLPFLMSYYSSERILAGEHQRLFSELQDRTRSCNWVACDDQ